MAKKFLTDLDLAKNELRNGRIQNLASAPSSPVAGQIYYDSTLNKFGVYNGNSTSWDYMGTGSGSGDVTAPSSSVDGEIALFNSTTGKLIKRATTSGLLKAASGVIAAAVSGTDYAPATSGTSALKGNGSGGFSNATLNDVGAPTTSYSMNSQKLTSVADPTSAQDAATKNYVDNAVQGLSWKTAARVATTANITLSGTQTIDGVAVIAGDRVLVKDQTTPSQNGIYLVAAGAWTRTNDADSSAELINATIYVSEGTANADRVWTLTTNASITVGTTALTFAEVNGGTTPAASTTTAGKVELATATETEARSDGTLAVTPAGLANFPVKKTFTIGDGAATQIDITHSLGTKEVITQVRQASDDAVVECDITNFSTSVVRLNFAVAPASNALKVVVMG